MATMVAEERARAVGERLSFLDRKHRQDHPTVQRDGRGKDRYSRFVGAMKFVLPGLAAGMLALILIWPNLKVAESGFRVGFLSGLKLDSLENLTLVRARYVGTDKENRPYMVTAEMANQVSPASERITLSVPAADITLEDGKWVALTAKSGEFDQKAKKLVLWGEVSIFHDDGYSFQTESAQVDLELGNAEGDDPVVGYGPLGSLTAKGFRVIDKGRRIIFTGESHLIARPGARAVMSSSMKKLIK